eukprot:5485679-Prymnesium_polylepis.1
MRTSAHCRMRRDAPPSTARAHARRSRCLLAVRSARACGDVLYVACCPRAAERLLVAPRGAACSVVPLAAKLPLRAVLPPLDAARPARDARDPAAGERQDGRAARVRGWDVGGDGLGGGRCAVLCGGPVVTSYVRAPSGVLRTYGS